MELARHEEVSGRTAIAKRIVRLSLVMESFQMLSNDQKNIYFGLCDSFNYWKNQKEFELDIETIQVVVSKQLVNTSKEVVAKVGLIYCRIIECPELFVLYVYVATLVMFKIYIFGRTLHLHYQVWGIFNTNCFENGVCTWLSRVNHSCAPNAEFVWNSQFSSQDLRLGV